MNRTSKIVLVAAAIAALLAVPALAGEGKKCEGTTQECLDYMATHMRERGWVGVEMEEAEGGYHKVTRVVEGSPAARSGVAVGDVLIAVNGLDVASGAKETWQKLEGQMKPGKTITYSVRRGAATRDIAVTLAEVPDAVLAQWVGRHMLDHATVEVARN